MPRSTYRSLRSPGLALALSAILGLSFSPAGAAAPPPLLGHPIEYVIVTSQALASAWAPLVDWKVRKGVPAAVKTLESIQAEYPVAADDAERVRRFLQDARAAGVRWALIGGDTDVIPIRLASTTFYTADDFPTDLYYACLDGTWNADGDGRYGEGFIDAGNPGDNADLFADIWVGRAPVSTPAEVARVVARTLQYERTPAGDYEDSRVFAAEVLFPANWTQGDPTTFDGADVVEPLLPMFGSHGLPVTRYYENWTNPAWVPGALQETRAAVRSAMNAGAGLMGVIGAGDETLISAADDFLTIADMSGLTNATRPFALWIMSSRVCKPDVESIGEAALLAPAGGAVAAIGHAHYGFPTAERPYFQNFMMAVHDTGLIHIGQAFARARQPYIPFSTFDGVNRWTQMSLTLLGDPELGIWTARPRALLVIHPPVTYPGAPVPVTVLHNGLPVAGATVTLYQAGQVLLVLVTDANGQTSGIPAGAIDGDIAVTVSGRDLDPYEGTVFFSTVTATTASLYRTELSPTRVRLTWDAPGWSAGEAGLERQDAAHSSWSAAGRIEPGAAGLIVSVDESVEPGAAYRYRIARGTGEAAELSAEAAIEVPAAHTFALEAITPNPIEAGARVAFSLAGGGEAQLEVFDLAGRVRWSRSLAGVAPGRRSFALDGVDRLPAGVYMLRLTEAGRMLARRVVVL